MPPRVERKGRAYWYDTYRVRSDVKKTYIGEDSGALRERCVASRRYAKIVKPPSQSCAAHPNPVYRDFLDVDAATGSPLNALTSAGVFRLGGTVVGTQAFRL